MPNDTMCMGVVSFHPPMSGVHFSLTGVDGYPVGLARRAGEALGDETPSEALGDETSSE